MTACPIQERIKFMTHTFAFEEILGGVSGNWRVQLTTRQGCFCTFYRKKKKDSVNVYLWKLSNRKGNTYWNIKFISTWRPLSHSKDSTMGLFVFLLQKSLFFEKYDIIFLAFFFFTMSILPLSSKLKLHGDFFKCHYFFKFFFCTAKPASLRIIIYYTIEIYYYLL